MGVSTTSQEASANSPKEDGPMPGCTPKESSKVSQENSEANLAGKSGHAGPKSKQVKQLKVAMINVGGAPGAWRALEALGHEYVEQQEEEQHDWDEQGAGDYSGAKDEDADIILIQELRMEDGEASALSNSAKKKGYRMHYAKGEVKQIGREFTRGGVATFVKQSLAQRRKAVVTKGLAQCLTVWVCGWVVLNSYAPPGVEAMGDHEWVLQESMLSIRLSENESWLWGADHNELPGDSGVAAIAAAWGGVRAESEGERYLEETEFRSTRWSGQKSIDHYYTNHRRAVGDTEQWREKKISDHICLKTTIKVGHGYRRDITQLKRTASYAKLDSIEKDTWREALAGAWARIDHNTLLQLVERQECDANTAEEEWDQFNAELQEMCREAVRGVMEKTELYLEEQGSQLGEEEQAALHADIELLRNKLRTKVPKGGTGTTETKEQDKNRLESEQQIQTKARRKRLARLFEAKNVLRERDTLETLTREQKNTVVKVRGGLGTEAGRDTIYVWICEEIKKEHKEADKAEAARNKTNIDAWRKRVQTSWEAVGRFLKKEATAAPDVTEKGRPLETREEVCQAIERHACSLPKKKKEKMKGRGETHEKQVAMVVEELQECGEVTGIEWANPTQEAILQKMREATGAGSPDGWHGQEIRHFPKEVAGMFGKITARWRRARKAPRAVKIARQCNLVKESKIKTDRNTIEAGDLRPISVISVWWRVYTSCWVTSEQITQWKRHYIPKEVVYDGQCTESCAANVFDNFCRLGFLATLDFSLCYDHIDPRLVCDAIKKLGIPGDLAELLEDVWTQIERYVLFEGNCSKAPFEAGEMLMQGDSFGPFALHVLMAAGYRWVQKAVEVWKRDPDWKSSSELQRPRLPIREAGPGESTSRRSVEPRGKGKAKAKPVPKRRRRVEEEEAQVNGGGEMNTLVYMDDRNITADDERTLCGAVLCWNEWSSRMGLLENEKKTRLIAKDARRKDKLRSEAEKHGMLEFVQDEAEVLGAVTRNLVRKLDKKEEARVKKADSIAKRVRILPVPRDRRKLALRMFAMSARTYGWISRNPPKCQEHKATNGALRSVYGGRCHEGSRALKCVLEGAQLDSTCVMLVRQAGVAKRAVGREAIRWTNEQGTLTKTVRIGLKDLGWREEGPWRWSIVISGRRRTIDLSEDDEEKEFEHWIRESYRRVMWLHFLEDKRRDSKEILESGDHEYPEEACKILRTRWLSPELRAVVCGSFWSHAAEKATRGEVEDCPWCRQEGVVASWDHCMWECPARTHTPQKPTCRIQSRLAWPTSDSVEVNEQVFAQAEAVVRKTWQNRYGDRAFNSETGNAKYPQPGPSAAEKRATA